MKAIEQQLYDIVQQELDIAPGVLNADSRFADLGDSLDWANLVFVIEGAFGIEVDEALSLQTTNMADLVALIEQAVPAGA